MESKGAISSTFPKEETKTVHLDCKQTLTAAPNCLLASTTTLTKNCAGTATVMFSYFAFLFLPLDGRRNSKSHPWRMLSRVLKKAPGLNPVGSLFFRKTSVLLYLTTHWDTGIEKYCRLLCTFTSKYSKFCTFRSLNFRIYVSSFIHFVTFFGPACTVVPPLTLK